MATLLRRQCGALANIEELADVLHRRTGGHPLFLASILDELIRPLKTQHASDPRRLDPSTVAKAIPLNVRRFIEYRLEQASAEDRQILEAASVAGEAFSVAAVAAGTMRSEEHVQRRCDLLRVAGLLVEDAVGELGGTALVRGRTASARRHFRLAEVFHDPGEHRSAVAAFGMDLGVFAPDLGHARDVV